MEVHSNRIQNRTGRAFVTTISYEAADDDSLQDGYEKVALFAKDGRVTHAARQLPSSLWTSKPGSDVDIEHELHRIEGEVYGTIVRVLKQSVAPPTQDDS